MAYVVIAILNLFLFALLLYTLLLVVRRLRFGRTRVRLNAFPFSLGGTLDAVFEGGAGLANAPGLNVTLRCIEEAIETHGHGKDRSTRLETPPTYWELTVRAALPSVDYEGVFLMPLYRPLS